MKSGIQSGLAWPAIRCCTAVATASNLISRSGQRGMRGRILRRIGCRALAVVDLVAELDLVQSQGQDLVREGEDLRRGRRGAHTLSHSLLAV